MEKEERPPGLRYNGKRPVWRASKSAIAEGYPLKSVHLTSLADNPVQLRQRCERLQAEMLSWLKGKRSNIDPQFDGTFRSLFDLYQVDKESPYHKLKRSSRVPYDVYLRMMRTNIGERLINACDGRDVKRWFAVWSEPAEGKTKRQVAKARMAIYVLKAALSFGILCRKPGCVEFRAVLDAIRFETLRPRDVALPADVVVKARAAAHAAAHPRAALCYAIQFEGAVRQWDVTGQWFPIADSQPSAVHDHGTKWIGPTWANIDENLILRWTPTKTEFTTGLPVVIDLAACPMVMEELALIPEAERVGPLIVNPKTGFPYRNDKFHDVWCDVKEAIGLSAKVWSRDLRKSGSTEARAAGAPLDDVKKLMGHAENSDTAAKVYDLAVLEAHRRIAAARVASRKK
ncbi:integrase [Bradyrhizobium sp. INPA01-394B]|uniref:Integrase n=1 Tax=Bradyrhizobium campsiandrae TaxID=1729892 RepID=A0ABR7U007_9BRAD|nr:integrase [Bradyrhizobium campsiandrae]MBC9875973.1 integrase [Bradyrhizobium campsiandrae]MBC9976918.1 integrase [Bradyrhizobium campsiandrae]